MERWKGGKLESGTGIVICETHSDSIPLHNISGSCFLVIWFWLQSCNRSFAGVNNNLHSFSAQTENSSRWWLPLVVVVCGINGGVEGGLDVLVIVKCDQKLQEPSPS